MSVCLNCGRALKNKTSIQRGYGPGCYKKIKQEVKRDYETKEEVADIEGQENFFNELKRKCS